MTSSAEEVSGWGSCRQGDSLPLDSLFLPREYDGRATEVVLVSQTCDIVQDRPTVLVAPLEEWGEADFKTVRRGQRPLHVPLAPGRSYQVVNLGYLTSVPRRSLNPEGRTPAPWQYESDAEARTFARRVGASLSRFAIPDHVVGLFSKLKDKVTKGTGKNGAFAVVMGHVLQIRVAAFPSWNAETLDLEVHLIVEEDQLLPIDAPSANDSSQDGKNLDEMKLNAVCEALASQEVGGGQRNALWRRFADLIEEEYLVTELGRCPRVREVTVDLYAESEYSYMRYRDSESLNLESLSPSG